MVYASLVGVFQQYDISSATNSSKEFFVADNLILIIYIYEEIKQFFFVALPH